RGIARESRRRGIRRGRNSQNSGCRGSSDSSPRVHHAQHGGCVRDAHRVPGKEDREGMSFRRTRAMARKELLHIVRDPRSLIAAIVQPLLMLLLFSYALSLDVDRIPAVIYDLDHTPVSNDLIADFRGSRYFSVIEEAQSYHPIERAMEQRRALAGIV